MLWEQLVAPKEGRHFPRCVDSPGGVARGVERDICCKLSNRYEDIINLVSDRAWGIASAHPWVGRRC